MNGFGNKPICNPNTGGKSKNPASRIIGIYLRKIGLTVLPFSPQKTWRVTRIRPLPSWKMASEGNCPDCGQTFPLLRGAAGTICKKCDRLSKYARESEGYKDIFVSLSISMSLQLLTLTLF